MENIVGALIAAIVGLMILPHFQSMVQQGSTLSMNATTAGQFRSLLEGGQKYTDKHSEDLISAVPVNGTPVFVPLTTLVNDSDLLPGFTAINPYGQTWAVYLTQPTDGTLSIIVESQGGTAISGLDEVRIASDTGEQGGFVPYDGMLGNLSSSTATGASRSWSMPLTSIPNPGPGHLVGLLQYSNAPVMNADYLYRDQVQGHPEFQTMQAALNMDGNTINSTGDIHSFGTISSGNDAGNGSVNAYMSNDGRINATKDIRGQVLRPGYIAQVGTPCDGATINTGTLEGMSSNNSQDTFTVQTGDIARDSIGATLTCIGGTWTSGRLTTSFYMVPEGDRIGMYIGSHNYCALIVGGVVTASSGGHTSSVSLVPQGMSFNPPTIQSGGLVTDASGKYQNWYLYRGWGSPIGAIAECLDW